MGQDIRTYVRAYYERYIQITSSIFTPLVRTENRQDVSIQNRVYCTEFYGVLDTSK